MGALEEVGASPFTVVSKGETWHLRPSSGPVQKWSPNLGNGRNMEDFSSENVTCRSCQQSTSVAPSRVGRAIWQ